MASTLKELSTEYAKKQPKVVGNITEEAPILSILRFEEASHGMWNVAEKDIEITAATFVDLDSALPLVGAESDLAKVDLAVMGGTMFCPEDKAQMMGGAKKYFAKKQAKVLKKTGMDLEKHFLYNTFRRNAIANGLAKSAGSSADACYSIIALRMEPGVNIGLYSPEGFKQGSMLDTKWLNNGALYERRDTGVLGYGLRLKGYFGWQVLGNRHISTIVNVDASNIPTEAMMDDMLADVRATGSNTVLLMHPRCRNLLKKYKRDRIEVSNGDKTVDGRMTHWDGEIPIITSYNFMEGTEESVTLA